MGVGETLCLYLPFVSYIYEVCGLMPSVMATKSPL